MIFGIILGTLLMGGLGTLSRYGAVSPAIATAFTLAVSSFLHLSLEGAVFMAIGVYICCSFSQTLGSQNGLTAETSAMLNLSPLATTAEYDRYLGVLNTFLKAAGMFLLWFLPLPKFPIFVGPLVLVFAVLMSAYSANNFKTRMGLLAVQSLVFALLCWMMRDSIPNPILGLIAAIAIPSLMLGGSMPKPVNYGEDPIRYTFVGVAVVLALMTPGYSLSCIVAGLFPKDISRSKYLAFMEGAMEGWVLKSFCLGDASGKTPLGDLLGNRPILLGNYEASPFLTAVIVLAVLVGLFTTWWLYRSGPEFEVSDFTYKHLIIFALATQGFLTCGLWMLPLLVAGAAMHVLRKSYDDDEESAALALLLPISIS